VAAGHFDAVMAPGPKQDWDLAAADLIATEAGARVTDNSDRAFIYNQPNPIQKGLVCSGPRLHPLLIERVAHIEAS
jgi:myo-inositol-1(or 4)-monophosphatase